jgi:hypothetical protein
VADAGRGASGSSSQRVPEAVGRLALQITELQSFTAEGLVDLRARLLDLERRCHELEGRLNEAVEQLDVADSSSAARAAKKRARRAKDQTG